MAPIAYPCNEGPDQSAHAHMKFLATGLQHWWPPQNILAIRESPKMVLTHIWSGLSLFDNDDIRTEFSYWAPFKFARQNAWIAIDRHISLSFYRTASRRQKGLTAYANSHDLDQAAHPRFLSRSFLLSNRSNGTYTLNPFGLSQDARLCRLFCSGLCYSQMRWAHLSSRATQFYGHAMNTNLDLKKQIHFLDR